MEHILFGCYPQTIKNDKVVIDEKVSYNINNWTCYKGSDNSYYVKEVAHNPNPATNSLYDKQSFSNGLKIIREEPYYFKMEAISQVILKENKDGSKLIMSEKALDTCPFDTHINKEDSSIIRLIDNKNIIPSDYKYSNIRAYLNSLNGSSYDIKDYSKEGFLSKAFNKEEQQRIKEVLVDNSERSAIPKELQKDNLSLWITPNTFSNTKDKVHLLSICEVENYDMTFRTRFSTDYTKAKGGFNFDGGEGCWWWLRSPEFSEVLGYEESNASFVQDDGYYDFGIRCDLSLCIIPLIVIKSYNIL